MARLYANENFPLPVVEELRKLEHDVLTIEETGKSDQSFPDEKVLEFATTEKRAVLTFIRGKVLTPEGNPVKDAIIELSDNTHQVKKKTKDPQKLGTRYARGVKTLAILQDTILPFPFNLQGGMFDIKPVDHFPDLLFQQNHLFFWQSAFYHNVSGQNVIFPIHGPDVGIMYPSYV
jgi:hypothetical protein